MFDTLEVFLVHSPEGKKQAHIGALAAAVAPRFEIQALEFVHDVDRQELCQIVRFSTDEEVFASGAAFEAAVLDTLAGLHLQNAFSWRRTGVVEVDRRHLIGA